jgi:glycosyltransferase involved in cell wall biosynthesis
MRLALVTNIISPHQMPLSRQLVARIGAANFRYIATEALDDNRRNLGWEERRTPDWVLCTDGDSKARCAAEEWLRQADVVLCGNRDVGLLERCVRARKLTFYMSERWFKPWRGRGRLLNPCYLRMLLAFRRVAHSPLLHYLPTGHYAARDIRFVAPFPHRMWLWGYYVDVAPELRPLQERTTGLQVLWAGRMLGWKRVDLLVGAVGRLRREGCDCRLTLVGYGERERALRKQVKKMGMGASVTFRPPVPVADMRGIMRGADVYVLPSNGYEGWGAVINEAMSEGCCMVASRDTGAAVTLIRDHENGLLFSSEEELCACLRRVYDSDTERIRLARTGYETISREWTPAVAAERLLALSEALLAGREPPVYAEGPLQQL